jgi:hypothetical protein
MAARPHVTRSPLSSACEMQAQSLYLSLCASLVLPGLRMFLLYSLLAIGMATVSDEDSRECEGDSSVRGNATRAPPLRLRT